MEKATEDRILADVLRRFLLTKEDLHHAWWMIHEDQLSLDGDCSLTEDEAIALWRVTGGQADSLNHIRIDLAAL
jgi:hypothetical protein